MLEWHAVLVQLLCKHPHSCRAITCCLLRCAVPQLHALERAATAKAFAIKRKEAYKLTLDNQDGASRFASIVSVSASMSMLLLSCTSAAVSAPALLLPAKCYPDRQHFGWHLS